MVNLALSLALTFAFYSLAGLALAGLCLRFSKLARDHHEMTSVMAVGLGPVVVGLLTAYFLTAFPGFQPLHYLIALLAIVWLLVVLGWRGARECIGDITQMLRQMVQFRRIAHLAMTFVLVALVGSASLYAVLFPVVANDPIGYVLGAEVISQARDLAVYPFVDSTQTGGYFGAWSHPPTFMTMMSFPLWIDAISGANGGGIALGLLGVWFAAFAALAIIQALGGVTRAAALLAGLIYLSTPYLYFLAVDNSIDPLRIFLTIPVLTFCALAKDRLTLGDYAFLGLLLGFGLAGHSLSIILIPVVVAILLFNQPGNWAGKAKSIAAVIVIGPIVVLPFYFKNVMTFGSLISDAPLLWQIEAFRYAEFVEIQRGLSSTYDKIFTGLLRGFSSLGLFGYAYWAFALATIGMVFFYAESVWRQILNILQGLWQGNEQLYGSLFSIAAFYGMAVLLLLLDNTSLIKNARYMLTPHPFIAIATALLAEQLWRNGYRSLIRASRASS